MNVIIFLWAVSGLTSDSRSPWKLYMNIPCLIGSYFAFKSSSTKEYLLYVELASVPTLCTRRLSANGDCFLKVRRAAERRTVGIEIISEDEIHIKIDEACQRVETCFIAQKGLILKVGKFPRIVQNPEHSRFFFRFVNRACAPRTNVASYVLAVAVAVREIVIETAIFSLPMSSAVHVFELIYR